MSFLLYGIRICSFDVLRCRKGTDAEEALKGEVRVLRQRLAMTERAHREIFEEKCELEEEENDSRLMVQR